MASERTMWLVYLPNNEGLCFYGSSEDRAWREARYGLVRETKSATRRLKALGWRCDRITVKDGGDE